MGTGILCRGADKSMPVLMCVTSCSEQSPQEDRGQSPSAAVPVSLGFTMNFAFFLESILLGVGLAMDAFSSSAVNGLNEPRMSRRKELLIAGTFGVFQALMPLIGWFCVHVIAEAFETFRKMTPAIALVLLLYIGGKMLISGIRGSDEGEKPALSTRDLMIQGVATSIDALSVGFTIAHYGFPAALVSSLIIGAVTFVICIGGVEIGKAFGTRLSKYAQIIGGCILIFIGIKIFFGF